MEEKHKKCSIKSHSEIDDVSYCQECNKYLFHIVKSVINICVINVKIIMLIFTKNVN